MVVSGGRRRNYGFVNKGKEKILEFQNLKIPNSSGSQCDFSNDLLGKETAGFGVEVVSVINGIVTNGIKGKLTLDICNLFPCGMGFRCFRFPMIFYYTLKS